MKYAAFDVETPNSQNRRMSAVGVTLLDETGITGNFSFLVNPETHFDPFNISLTGITPAMVKDSPAFPQLWKELEELLSGRTLLAHNAPFDLGVLSKCLMDYGISWGPLVPYLCPCRMSRKLLPELPDHRLNTLADYFAIPLRHHEAASDSQACGEIFLRHVRSGADPAPFLRLYDLERHRTLPRGRWA